MTQLCFLKPTPEQISQICSNLKTQGIGTEKRLKYAKHTPARYLRYVPQGFIDVLKENLWWDTRYLKAGRRTVIIFEAEAIERLFEELEIPSKYYSRAF